ncbi:pseudouridine synthase [Lachnospiraceae bacterium 64-25]
MRIDRLLCEMNIGTRSKVKELIKKGQVSVDGKVICKPEQHIDETRAKITCMGREYVYRPYVYYMMNKPAGVITATTDERERTVLDLLKEQLKVRFGEEGAGVPLRDIFPVGRLDKDTVGLLLLTNDGALAHNLLSPSKHVAKQYFVRTDMNVTNEQERNLESGVMIGQNEKTRPAQVILKGENECYITITEGKYHQIKRMFHAVGNKVIYLKRMSMGSLVLDETLAEGQIRELTPKEVTDLCSRI